MPIDKSTGTGEVNGYYIGPGANLEGADLFGADLYCVNLWRSNLLGAQLVEAILVNAYLEGADLEGANLSRAILRDTTFSGANLFLADFTGCTGIDSADFQGAFMDDKLRHYIIARGGKV